MRKINNYYIENEIVCINITFCLEHQFLFLFLFLDFEHLKSYKHNILISYKRDKIYSRSQALPTRQQHK